MSTENREQRNAVLASGGEGGIQTMTREEAVKMEFGLDIPIEAVPLPSQGKVYSAGHALHGLGSVEYHGMTSREEDILMSRAYLKKGTVITELIKSCVIDKNIDVQSMLTGDRYALMIAIRASGYGSLYEPQFECPSPMCGHTNKLSIDLNALQIKPLKIEPLQPFTNMFEFKLPKSGATVVFKFLDGHDEEQVLADAEARKKKGFLNENLVTTRLRYSILSVNGDSSKSTIAKFANCMPAQDSLALREHISEHEPTVDMSVDFTCINCDSYKQIQLPFGPSFFWPGSGG